MYKQNNITAYLHSKRGCSKHGAAIYWLNLGRQVVKQDYSSAFRRWGNRNGKPMWLLKESRTVASQKLLPAPPSQTVQHITGLPCSTNHPITEGWFLTPLPTFNCSFSPQREPQGSERFECISINTFYPMLPAWWPTRFPRGQALHLKALPVTLYKRPNSEQSLSASHWQRWHPKRGLAEQQDSIRSSSSPLSKGLLPAKRLSPAPVCSDRVSKGTWA